MKTKSGQNDDAMAVNHHFRLVNQLGRSLDGSQLEHRLASDKFERSVGVPRVAKVDDCWKVIQPGTEWDCWILLVDAVVIKTVHISPSRGTHIKEHAFLFTGRIKRRPLHDRRPFEFNVRVDLARANIIKPYNLLLRPFPKIPCLILPRLTNVFKHVHLLPGRIGKMADKVGVHFIVLPLLTEHVLGRDGDLPERHGRSKQQR